MNFIRKHAEIFAFVFLAAAVRFLNLPRTLYFIWDQGRDAVMLQRISSGDIVLLGPTSGIAGFFLGPLWFYAGLPGYILSNGNPYGIAVGYMLLASVALPLYWLLAHRLFPKHKWVARGLATGLALISGSIHGSIFIWNPLISLPLVAGAVYCLLRAREHRAWLTAGFFLFALTLQSEFAYAIFFLGPLVLMIPWMRNWTKQTREWRDFVYPAMAGAVTLIPQVLAELKTNFAMTKALIAGMQNTDHQVSWGELWSTRPFQLFDAVRLQLVNNIPYSNFWAALLLICAVAAIVAIWKNSESARSSESSSARFLTSYEWKLVTILALLPFIFFMFWRSNYGYFFEYYITPHFILVLPLIAGGLTILAESRLKILKQKISLLPLALALTLPLVWGSWHTISTEILFAENNAGLRRMIEAADQVLNWQQEDGLQQGTVLVYTPNIQTEHHDFVMQWRAKQRDMAVPITVKQAEIETWYLLMEPPAKGKEVLFERWYLEKTAGGTKTREMQVGSMRLETWEIAQTP